MARVVMSALQIPRRRTREGILIPRPVGVEPLADSARQNHLGRGHQRADRPTLLSLRYHREIELTIGPTVPQRRIGLATFVAQTSGSPNIASLQSRSPYDFGDLAEELRQLGWSVNGWE